jgi:integrase
MTKATTVRLTKTAVERLQPGDMLRDTETKGFGVRRQVGPPVYFLRKKIHGRDRWVIIGQHGAPWTPDTARREAQRLIGLIATGADPSSRARDLDDPSLEQAAELFLSEHGTKLKPRTQIKYEGIFRLHILPLCGHLKASEFSRADVLRLHARMSEKSSTANYAVAVVSKLMSWCEERGIRTQRSNPCHQIKKYREQKRQRYLSREEYARLASVLDDQLAKDSESIFVVNALRLLILTGARLGEITTLKWSHVDLQRGLLILPDSKTGQKTIRLNSQAIDILQKTPRLRGNEYVIAGRLAGQPIVNLQKPWRRLRAEAGLDDVRIHDLRHSFASIAAASGASLPMIGAMLGHSQPQTTARYAHLADDPLRQVNQQVGDAIAEAFGQPDQSRK